MRKTASVKQKQQKEENHLADIHAFLSMSTHTTHDLQDSAAEAGLKLVPAWPAPPARSRPISSTHP